MKTRHELLTARYMIVAPGIAVLFGLRSAAIAQEKGAEKLMKLNRLPASEDVQAVQHGETVAMSCPKCKDIWVTVMKPTFKGAAARRSIS